MFFKLIQLLWMKPYCCFFSDPRFRLPAQALIRTMSSSDGPTSAPYTTLAISRPAESVTHVQLHRPEKLNAMNKAFWRQESTESCFLLYWNFTYSQIWSWSLWVKSFLKFWVFFREMVECFNEISEDKDCRVVVVSGAGKIFTSGGCLAALTPLASFKVWCFYLFIFPSALLISRSGLDGHGGRRAPAGRRGRGQDRLELEKNRHQVSRNVLRHREGQSSGWSPRRMKSWVKMLTLFCSCSVRSL